ncbi:hypothetical protein Csa_002690 [Cucumis sativus]|uniref:Uncharacterized protein n=1 Tax=Cucumis sativus TaxID=3659 RepID=A0A0A0LDJ5_CUCSA|nr:hypothetical protein Csa_002690 [Cucumis sativus]
MLCTFVSSIYTVCNVSVTIFSRVYAFCSEMAVWSPGLCSLPCLQLHDNIEDGYSDFKNGVHESNQAVKVTQVSIRHFSSVTKLLINLISK